jgi:hypothetical protein
MVSGTISLPLRGTFHLSLTVLVRYRSPLVFSLAGWSPLIRSGFHVSGSTQEPTGSRTSFAYGPLTLFGRTFQTVRLPARFVTPRPPCGATMLALQPRIRNARRLSRTRFGLLPFRSPLLRESRLSLFSSGYSDVSFPRVPSSCPMCSGRGDTALPVPGFPIRRSVLQSSLAAPHGLSQLATSFFGFRCQGIHHTPLVS